MNDPFTAACRVARAGNRGPDQVWASARGVRTGAETDKEGQREGGDLESGPGSHQVAGGSRLQGQLPVLRTQTPRSLPPQTLSFSKPNMRASLKLPLLRALRATLTVTCGKILGPLLSGGGGHPVTAVAPWAGRDPRVGTLHPNCRVTSTQNEATTTTTTTLFPSTQSLSLCPRVLGVLEPPLPAGPAVPGAAARACTGGTWGRPRLVRRLLTPLSPSGPLRSPSHQDAPAPPQWAGKAGQEAAPPRRLCPPRW